jgi:PhzF family phenazine biosynthesis protein
MQKTPYYEIHAFATDDCGGNPAGVCPLAQWLPDATMQAIAEANNLPETVFFVQQTDGYAVRYFTPNLEVDLCGHAPLASAWLLFQKLGFAADRIEFNCRAGKLFVTQRAGGLYMSLPVLPYQPIPLSQELREGLSHLPLATYRSTYDLLCVYEHVEHIEAIAFAASTFNNFPYRGLILTAAPGTRTDIYSRCFFPRSDVFEDPVTGSAHAVLAPFWIKQLNKPIISAEQGLRRRGVLHCEVLDDRVWMHGACKLFMEGTIFY